MGANNLNAGNVANQIFSYLAFMFVLWPGFHLKSTSLESKTPTIMTCQTVIRQDEKI